MQRPILDLISARCWCRTTRDEPIAADVRRGSPTSSQPRPRTVRLAGAIRHRGHWPRRPACPAATGRVQVRQGRDQVLVGAGRRAPEGPGRLRLSRGAGRALRRRTRAGRLLARRHLRQGRVRGPSRGTANRRDDAGRRLARIYRRRRRGAHPAPRRRAAAGCPPFAVLRRSPGRTPRLEPVGAW